MSTAVRDFYNAFGAGEVERLSSVYCTFEFRNNLGLMFKYLPPSCRILEVGAGPGQYSLPLLRAGYRVTLFDISEVLLNIARQEFEKNGVVPEDIICDDAVNLDRVPDAHYDAILLMGPMYHILDPRERHNVLSLVHKKMKPGGIALLEFINAWGVLKAGLHEFPQEYENDASLRRYLGEIAIDTSIEPLNQFTDVYLTTPPDAQQQISDAGFTVISYAGTESFAAGMHTDIEALYNNNRRAFDNVVEFSFDLCERHPFRDTTEHLTYVVEKPGVAAP